MKMPHRVDARVLRAAQSAKVIPTDTIKIYIYICLDFSIIAEI